MIIGLVGFAGAGKDEAARGLPEWDRKAFADELKKMAASMLRGCFPSNPKCKYLSNSLLDFSDYETKQLFRPFLVGLGAAMRNVDLDYWIKRLIQSAPAAFAPPGHGDIPGIRVVVTDVRYLNEAKWIMEELKGQLFYIERPGIHAANDEEAKSIRKVREEYDLPIILNNGSIAELHDLIRKEV